ncbi:MAG TPA: hypothetical protein P5137_16865 [Candidatus Brocadiia bacterium]|nr:hypothetical protein [Candidatus Brocadiia bacterium]
MRQVRLSRHAPPRLSDTPQQPTQAGVPSPPRVTDGLRCPNCWCRDLRLQTDPDAGPIPGLDWDVTSTRRIPNAIRRYRVCRNCGYIVRTREVIDRPIQRASLDPHRSTN